VDCHVGVWHIDGAGVVTQLFPNDQEPDNFLKAKVPATIPGQESYSIQVSPGRSPEYLWVAATTQAWDLAAGHRLGPGVVLAAPEQISSADVRAAALVARGGPRVSECVVQLDVGSPLNLAANLPQ
jgi:hypothetical protein